MSKAIPHVVRLFIYPIKALDRVEVPWAEVLKSGALKHDRVLAMVDPTGKFVNGKRNPKVHALRTEFDLENDRVSIAIQGEDWQRFHLTTERPGLATWLSDYFDLPVQLQQNLDRGFPDDTDSPGPTVISTATLETIASWYPGLDVEAVRLRFRANIEIDGVPAFWEDQLFAGAEQQVAFTIGDVTFLGINPCQRCIVVTRDAHTGEAYPDFQKTFSAKRQAMLPDWADRSRFNHFYRVAVNTCVNPEAAGKVIRVGDKVKR